VGWTGPVVLHYAGTGRGHTRECSKVQLMGWTGPEVLQYAGMGSTLYLEVLRSPGSGLDWPGSLTI
jgi:hypothetical protein